MATQESLHAAGWDSARPACVSGVCLLGWGCGWRGPKGHTEALGAVGTWAPSLLGWGCGAHVVRTSLALENW